MKPRPGIAALLILLAPLFAHAQDEMLTEIPLGLPGETKLIHVSQNPNFPREGILKFSTSNDKLNANLKPGRYFYRYRSNSNAQRAISKSGKITIEAPTSGEATKTDHSIEWTPPMDSKTQEKIPFFWSVTDSKGNFVVKDQVITEENPSVTLLHAGTYYWTMTDELGASWTVPQQVFVNPFPPSAVAAVVNKDRSVDIAWQASPNLESFLVKIVDDEGYEVYSATRTDKALSLPNFPEGSYQVFVHGTITMNGRYGVDPEPNINLTSKPITTTFQVPENTDRNEQSPLVILSPVGRINFEGQKYLFSWHVKGEIKPKKYRLQVRSRDAKGLYSDVSLIDVPTTFDDSIFPTLALGHYKFRVAALNEKGEQIPGWSDKTEFSIESQIGEARIGKITQNNLSFGPDVSLMTYQSQTNLASNNLTATMMGLFIRHEKSGELNSADRFSYTMKEVRSQYFVQGSQTLTQSELTIGCGQFSSASASGWVTKYGIHGSLIRTPEVVGGPITQTGQINFLSARPRLELSQINKHYSLFLNFEASLPLIQFSDQLTFKTDPAARLALGYQASIDMQFPFFWPWSAGVHLGYSRNDFRYHSPLTSSDTDSSLTGFTGKLYLSYPY